MRWPFKITSLVIVCYINLSRTCTQFPYAHGQSYQQSWPRLFENCGAMTPCLLLNALKLETLRSSNILKYPPSTSFIFYKTVSLQFLQYIALCGEPDRLQCSINVESNSCYTVLFEQMRFSYSKTFETEREGTLVL